LGISLDAARAAVKAESQGAKLLRTVKVGDRDIFQLSEEALKKGVANLEDAIAKNEARLAGATREQAGVIRSELRHQRKELKNQQKTLKDRPAMNEILKDLQVKRGLTREELLKVPTVSEQLASGERSLLGWVSPVSGASVPFRNLRGFDRAARALPVIGGANRFGAAAARGVERTFTGSRDAATKGVNAIIRVLRGDRDLRPGILPQQMREAQQLIKEAALKHLGDNNLFMREAEQWIRRYSHLGPEQLRELTLALENRNPALLGRLESVRELIEQTPYDELQAQIVSKVTSVPEGNLTTGRLLTPGQQLRFNPSRLSQTEIKSALAEWDGATSKPYRMASGHTFRFDDRNVVVRLGGNTTLGRKSKGQLETIFHSQSMANVAGVPNYRVVIRSKLPKDFQPIIPDFEGHFGLRRDIPLEFEAIGFREDPGGAATVLGRSLRTGKTKQFTEADRAKLRESREAKEFRAAEREEVKDIFTGKPRVAPSPQVEKFLVARNMPSAGLFHNSRVRNTHLQNLGSAAARLALLKKGLVDLAPVADSPIPVLVSPFGGVQILSPEVFLKGRSFEEARDISRAAIRQLVADRTTMDPRALELPMLSSVRTARKVGVGAKKYIMEPSPADEFLELAEGGVGHIDVNWIIDSAENTAWIRQLLRGQTPDMSPISAFMKANEIDDARTRMQAAWAAGQKASAKPLVITRGQDGRIYVVDGLNELAAAAIEDVATIPVYRKAYLGEEVAKGGDYYNSYNLRGYDVVDQHHTNPTARAITEEVEKAAKADKAATDAGRQLKGIQGRIHEFNQEKDSLIAELSRLSAKEAPDDLEVLAVESRLAAVGEELTKLEGQAARLRSVGARLADQPGTLPRVQGALDEDYRILDRSGGPVRLTAASLRATSPEEVLAQERLLEGARRLLVQRGGPSARTLAAEWEALRGELITAYGNVEGAALRLSDFGETSGDFRTFADTLLRDMQAQGSRFSGFPVSRQRRQALAARERIFQEELKTAAMDHLDALAGKGIFTTNSLTPQRAILASRKLDATVLFNQGNNFRITNVGRTAEELQKFAKEQLPVNPADVYRRDQMVLQSSEGERAIEFGDLVEGAHPRLFRVDPIPTVLRISEAEKIRLAENDIFHVPPTGEFAELEPYLSASRVVNQETKSMLFFRTKSGDMFVKTAALPAEENVASMVGEVFGEGIGAVRLQEWGYILDNKVVVNNPLGGAVRTLNNSNLKGLENQLRQMAKQFKSMGFTGELEMEVFTPLSDGLWQDIYRRQFRRPSLDKVASKEFRLRVPKQWTESVGKEMDLNLATPVGSVRIDRDVLSPEVQPVFDWMTKSLDEVIEAEILAGVPEGRLSNYAPREMTKEARDAFNELWSKHLNQNPKLRRVVNSFPHMKERKFTALGIDEINRIQDLTDFELRDIMRSADAAEQARYLRALKEVFPSGLQFFHVNPIFTTILRKLKSFRLRAAQDTLEAAARTENSGVFFAGTSKEFSKLARRNAGIDRMKRQVSQLEDSNSLMEVRKAELGPSDATREAFRELEERIAQNDRKIDDLVIKINKAEEESAKVHLIAGRVPENPETVWIAGSHARRLTKSGVLGEADTLSHPSEDIVRIRYSDKVKALGDNGEIKTYFMTPEGEELMSRYFRIVNKNMPNILRGVQRLTSIFKQITLFPMPQFHIRNAIADFWLIAAAGEGDMASFQLAMDHMMMLRRYGRNKITKEEAYSWMAARPIHSSATGEVRDVGWLWNRALGQGITTDTFVMNDFNVALEASGVMRDFEKVLHRAGVPRASHWAARSTPVDIGPVRFGKDVQEFREAWQRFGLFLHHWQRTGDVREAGLQVKKVLYDYNALTSFERDWLRNLAIPFYSWLRFNTPRMVQLLGENPTFMARTHAFLHRLYRDPAGQPVDESKLPEWAKSSGAFILSRNRDGSYRALFGEGLLPMYDLFPLASLESQGLIQYGLNQTNPILKLPVEQMINYTIFQRRPIEAVPGEPARSGTLAKLGMTRRATAAEGAPLGVINLLWNEKNLDLFRIGKQVSRLFDWVTNHPNMSGDRNVSALAMLAELTVGRTIDLDPRLAGIFAQRDQRSLLRKLESRTRQAEREGNITARNSLVRQLNALRLATPPER
jgi:hypothetical protein